MKTFVVAVTGSLLLTFLRVQENSAVPVHEDLEVPTDDGSLTADRDTPEESWNMPHDSVRMCSRRRFCCPNQRGCGTCCKF